MKQLSENEEKEAEVDIAQLAIQAINEQKVKEFTWTDALSLLSKVIK